MSGHRRITNFESGEAAAVHETDVILEAAESRHDRTTLPYYRAPGRRRRIDESAALEDVSSSEETAVDVAAASFGDSTFLEVVIGRDDRVKVKNALLTTPPWRQICALRIRAQTGRAYVGTAWFVGPRLLATAGHCVYMLQQGGWAESIEVLPALRGNVSAGRMTATRFGSVSGWIREHKRDFDYGVIFLDEDTLGKRLGNFAVQSMADAVLKGRHAKISGYPADRDRAEYQYFHERPVISTTAATFVYDIDTYGGQSGSPVWCDTEEDGLVAVGIHTTGSALGNSATRITDEVIENLVHWLDDGA